MSPEVKTLDISPVGRVEGDLDVRVNIQDGVVVDAWTSAALFRGLEVILKGKDPQAGLIVTPRACGICGASHLTCASWALDTAWATTLPRNAILARNIGQLCESLQSIPRHHYAIFSVDFTNKNYRRSRYYEEATERWAPFTGRNYEIGLGISGKPTEIYALFGGQWPHSSYMVPGGVMCAPTLTDVTRAWSILEYIRTVWLEPVWLGCSIERFEEIKTYKDFLNWLDEKEEHARSDLGLMWRMGLDIGLDKYGKGLGRYMAYGYLPHEDLYQQPTIDSRASVVRMPGGIYDANLDRYFHINQADIREDVSRAFYDEPLGVVHPFERSTNPTGSETADYDGKYSWSTAVEHSEFGRLETGPLARQMVYGSEPSEKWQYYDPLVRDMHKQMNGASVLLRHFARMHESVSIYI